LKQKGKWLTRDIFYWSLYDFANSTFATIIVAFVYAVYFKKVVASNQPIGDLWWSVAINISMITVALISPLLGAAADHFGNKKNFLVFFTLLSVVATSLLYFVEEGMVFTGALIFIIANIGFQAGLGFYDAFIKDITEEKYYNKVSSLGYAVGYMGSLLSLVVVIILKDEPRLTFVACSILYLMFSIPLFLFVREKKLFTHGLNSSNFIITGYRRITDTFRNIKKYRNLRLFLISFFLYIDGVNTIIFFSANYAQTTLNFEITDLIIFFVIVQITALLGSFFFGWIADINGTKKTLVFILICWTLVTLSVYFADSRNVFFTIGAVAGTLLGSSQALSRSLMSRLTPENKKAEFFGFYSLFEKTSTILGPLAFGLISWLSGNQRYAALSLSLFFITGLLIFRKVEYKKPVTD
jgi:UMF1 family MFS transporter